MTMFAETGGVEHIHRWDLRNISGGPVRKYKAPGVDNGKYRIVTCLAVDPRQKTVLSGGTDGVVCWDVETDAFCIRLTGQLHSLSGLVSRHLFDHSACACTGSWLGHNTNLRSMPI
jgi:hypothetical protein